MGMPKVVRLGWYLLIENAIVALACLRPSGMLVGRGAAVVTAIEGGSWRWLAFWLLFCGTQLGVGMRKGRALRR